MLWVLKISRGYTPLLFGKSPIFARVAFLARFLLTGQNYVDRKYISKSKLSKHHRTSRILCVAPLEDIGRPPTQATNQSRLQFLHFSAQAQNLAAIDQSGKVEGRAAPSNF